MQGGFPSLYVRYQKLSECFSFDCHNCRFANFELFFMIFVLAATFTWFDKCMILNLFFLNYIDTTKQIIIEHQTGTI